MHYWLAALFLAAVMVVTIRKTHRPPADSGLSLDAERRIRNAQRQHERVRARRTE